MLNVYTLHNIICSEYLKEYRADLRRRCGVRKVYIKIYTANTPNLFTTLKTSVSLANFFLQHFNTYIASDLKIWLKCCCMLDHEIWFDFAEQVQCGQTSHLTLTASSPF